MRTTILDYLRITLYALLAVVVFFLYQAWNKEHPAALSPQAITTTSENYVPDVTKALEHTTVAVAPTATTTSNVMHVKTDLFAITIDKQGGNITEVKLLKYPEKQHGTTPFLLLNNFAETRYLAQSGLLSQQGPDTSKGQAFYTTKQDEFVLAENQQDMPVILEWKNENGVIISKIFTFHRNSYEINVNYTINNLSNQPWQGNLYLQLMRKDTPPENTQGLVNFATYFGAAISSPDKPFQKISFDQMKKQPLNQSVVGGWAAMIQHYFVSAWIPDSHYTSQYFSKLTTDGLYTIGMIGPELTVPAGQQLDTKAKFYAGPTIPDQLEKASPSLKLTIDYGWFWFISAIIFWMMQHIFDVVGNWGWSIVIVTLIIKLMFYHLSAKSYRSMSGLKKLQPKIAALKERFGDDKQKFTQATLELYKKEKVNPMSGCLPILIQVPVFIGLYWVLIESVQLRHAPFIFWIQDLSVKDPFYILPLFMGLSMFLQQRLNPPPADPTQAKIMMMMPVVFTIMFANFPAGLMLYWFVNNTLSFLQQWYIMQRMEKAAKKSKT